jgi:uncharacterized protein YdhG (YjbR/CyaY superfamily)
MSYDLLARLDDYRPILVSASFTFGRLERGLGLEILASIARMKSVKSANRSSAVKAKVAPKNVDEYIAALPEPARSTLKKMRAAIRSAVPPEDNETISYRIPAFKHKRVLVWFAAFANHCSLFPTAAVIAAFKNDLKGFSTSKGTIHFSTDKPLPISLIKKLVKARVAQIESKKRR